MITFDKVPLEPTQVDKLRTLLASREYATLREVIGARATEEAVQFTNASLYKTDQAIEVASTHRENAIVLTHALDVLDQLEKDGEWFRLKLDQRR